MIHFGTDGWRGEIARDFTFENIRKVALATAEYIKKNSPENMTAVIGFDARFLSDKFAEETAAVFAAKGIKSYISDDIASTPQVSMHTKEKKAALGIIITASHNPAEYNGYKIKANFGGPAVPATVKAVEAELAEIWDNMPEMNLKTVGEYIDSKMIIPFDAKTDYIEKIKSTVDIDAILKADFKVLYDPMHGSGINTINMLLPEADQIHSSYNPSFGNIDHPEPMGEYLPDLLKMVKDYKYDIGIATDGDADRVGLVDGEGCFVDSHKIFMIILKYLSEYKKMEGCVVKTVSLTQMVNKYCESRNIELFETPVGFKYTAEMMTDGKHNVLVGGEESGGLGTALHIPERDGLFIALLVMEVMAKRQKSLKELVNELNEEFGEHHYKRIDKRVTQEIKEKVLADAAKKPTEIAGLKVIDYNFKDGYKFIFENGWLLIRASGTEPLLRFYAEAESQENVLKLLEEVTK